MQYLANQFNALLTSATLHASQRGYEYAGGDPVGPRPRLHAVRPAEAGRCNQSFMK